MSIHNPMGYDRPNPYFFMIHAWPEAPYFITCFGLYEQGSGSDGEGEGDSD